jgi:hypothetical protein
VTRAEQDTLRARAARLAEIEEALREWSQADLCEVAAAETLSNDLHEAATDVTWEAAYERLVRAEARLHELAKVST